MVSQPAYAEQQNSVQSTAMTRGKHLQPRDRDTTVIAGPAGRYALGDTMLIHTLRVRSQRVRCWS